MRKKPIPMPVNLNDCCLLYQMGYTTVIHDGKVGEVTKERRRKSGRIKNSERNRRAYQRA